ncbi:hypothetical protein L6452_13743 [Arctium lappa]|uniref:Uncharacterized protein n=1 Tax=Arctium lappa TaxID=4217 RepID=A0ACB9CJ48_ARCLA|nr:hypothetical protein L6452_13743 [Arctium lappa]
MHSLLLYPRSLPSTVMMEMIRGAFKKKKGDFHPQDHGFSQLILSWSLDDIVYDQLYKFQKRNHNSSFEAEPPLSRIGKVL